MPLFARLSLALALVVASASLALAGERERRITDALIWMGETERVARSRIDRSDRAAILRFERGIGGYADGRLDRGERSILFRIAEALREKEGYRIRTDKRTGVRLGLPTAWLGRATGTAEGTRWRSPDGAITIETFRDVRGLSARRARERSRGDEITYRTGGRNWFVLSGYRNGNAYYVRAAARGNEVRGYRVEYDPDLRSRLDRVVVAMSSDFSAFAARPSAGLENVFARLPQTGPAVRNRPVEFASLEPIAPRREAVRREELRPAPEPRPVPRAATPSNDPIPPLGPEFGPPAPLIEEPEEPPQRAGLEPLSEAPVPDTGEEVEDAVPNEITGMLTDEGQSCPTLRAANGALYALVGEVPSVEAGTMVTIQAKEIESARCSAGRPVAVSGFRVRSLR